MERAAAGIRLHVNTHKTEYMCYNQTGDISTLDRTSLKLVDKFTYLGSSVSSTEKDIDTRLTKAWTAIDRLSIIWKSDLTDKMKRSFFQAAVVSILLYGCTTWTLTKRLEKKLDGNYTRMLRAILNKSWRQHPTRHQLYGHLPPITKTIQARRTRHAVQCWRSKDELISDVLLWTPAYDRVKAGRPAVVYSYARRNIFNTIKRSGHTSLEKYTSHFIERIVCERELETEQRLQHIDPPPTLLAITAFLSRSPGLPNWGPSLCWDMVLIPASFLQLI